MGVFERLKNRTVEDVVETAKEKVGDVMRTGMEERTRTVLYLLPIAATAVILFRTSEEKPHRGAPTRQVINNYYYYGDREVKPHVHRNR